MNNQTEIIGISGGTGSGKTYLANKLISIYKSNKIQCIEVDSYYKDLSHLDMSQRIKTNFDHPSSFDFDLLINDLSRIKRKQPISIPIYDYKTHTRKNKTRLINSQNELIILEGIYALYLEEIREMFSLSIYINVENKLRKERRIKRDILTRDRTYKSVIAQYKTSVLPMHNEYVKPSKEFADIVIKKLDKTDMNYVKLFTTINHMIN